MKVVEILHAGDVLLLDTRFEDLKDKQKKLDKKMISEDVKVKIDSYIVEAGLAALDSKNNEAKIKKASKSPIRFSLERSIKALDASKARYLWLESLRDVLFNEAETLKFDRWIQNSQKLVNSFDSTSTCPELFKSVADLRTYIVSKASLIEQKFNTASCEYSMRCKYFKLSYGPSYKKRYSKSSNYDYISNLSKQELFSYIKYHSSFSCNLRDIDLSNLDLSHLDLSKFVLEGCIMHNCICVGTIFEGAHMRFADLKGSNLTFANLKNTDLTCSNICEVSALGADFTGANLKGSLIFFTNFYKAITKETCFDGTIFGDGNFYLENYLEF